MYYIIFLLICVVFVIVALIWRKGSSIKLIEVVDMHGSNQLPFSILQSLLLAVLSPFLKSRLVRQKRQRAVPSVHLRFLRVKQDVDLRHRLALLRGDQLSSSIEFTYWEVATFPQIIRCMTSNNFPFPLLGSVHLRNRIDQYKLMPLDDEYTIDIEAGTSMSHKRGTVVRFIVQVKNSQTEELLWKNEADFLFFGSGGISSKDDQRDADLLKRFTVENIRTLSSDTSVRQIPLYLEADLGRRYASICKDYNPIHVSNLLSPLFGFKQMIVHGMCLLEKTLPMIEQELQHAGTINNHRSLLTVFRKPVFLPSTPQAFIWKEIVQNDKNCVYFAHKDSKGSVCQYGTFIETPN